MEEPAAVSPDLVDAVRAVLRQEFAAGLEKIRRIDNEEEEVEPSADQGEVRSSTVAPTAASECAAGVREALQAEFALGLEQICKLVHEKLDCENGSEEDEEPRCAKGHPLRAAAVPNDTFCCDKCKAMIPKGTVLFGCRRCNYDECQSCCGKTAEFISARKESGDSDESDSDDSWGDGEVSPEEARKLIICVRGDINMTIGKTAAQVGHAVHSAVRHSTWQDLQAWEACGSKKVTLKVDSQAHLLEIRKAARDAGLVAESIRDAGHTELEPGTMTVLAVGPSLDTRIDELTGQLKPIQDNLRRENEKLKDKFAKVEKELDAVRKDKKQLRQEKLRLLEMMKAYSSLDYH